MRHPEENFAQERDYFQQEAGKVHQLRKLLHSHDLQWHKNEEADSMPFSELDELGSASPVKRDTSRQSEDVKTVTLIEPGSASSCEADDQIDWLDRDQQPSQSFLELKNDLRHKFVRMLLEFCALVCHLDLFCSKIRERRHIQFTLFDGLIRLRLFSYVIMSPSRWFQHSRWVNLLSRLVLLLYTSCVAHLLYYLYHQYIYDYYLFRLMRVRWLNATHLAEAQARKLTLEREDLLLEHIEAGEQHIRRIGGPQMHMSFAVECVYLMFLIASLVAYIFTRLYYNYHVPFNFYFVRNFIDYPEEQRNQRQFLRDQVRNFIDSSRNHTRALTSFSRKSLGARLYFERYGSRLRQPVQRARRRSVRPGVDNIHQPQLDRKLDENCSEFNLNVESLYEADKTDATGAVPALFDELNADELDELVFPESFSCKQLRTLLESNDLRPMNQTLSWVAHQLHRYCYLCLLFITVVFLFDASVIYLIFVHFKPPRQMSLGDLLVGTDLVFLLLICNITSLFYSTINVFTAIDQAEMAGKLRQLIVLVIDLNTLRFYKNLHLRARVQHLKEARRNTLISLREFNGAPETLLDSAPSNYEKLRFELTSNQRQVAMFDTNYENSMNKDILLAVMHYKTFVAGMLPLMGPLQVACFLWVAVMFIFPIIGRLHMSYFKPEIAQDARFLTVALSLLVIVPIDINLIPICYLHKRFTNLYDQLNYLLAHATDITNQPEGRSVYDRHIISTLRKELCFPQRMVSKFAIKVNNFSFTYPGLVRLHFYFGFIVLSIFNENPSSQEEVVGTLWQDPFGIF